MITTLRNLLDPKTWKVIGLVILVGVPATIAFVLNWQLGSLQEDYDKKIEYIAKLESANKDYEVENDELVAQNHQALEDFGALQMQYRLAEERTAKLNYQLASFESQEKQSLDKLDQMSLRPEQCEEDAVAIASNSPSDSKAHSNRKEGVIYEDVLNATVSMDVVLLANNDSSS